MENKSTCHMTNEMRLIPCGEKVTLDELPPGTIFAFGEDCIAVKSEYRCNNGLIEAFIIDSGEQFWGGVHTAEEQNALIVQPLEIEEVDAVPVVHGRWVLTANEEHANYRWNVTAECSECHHSKGEIWAGFFPGFPKTLAEDLALENAECVKLDNYCPNCGADMRGERK